MALISTKYGKTKEYDKPLYENPKSAQQVYSIKSIDETGIFELPDNTFSKCFILSDINFAGVTDAEQKEIIINLAKTYNAMNCRFQISVANEYVDETEFNNQILYRLYGDELDNLRDCYNHVIKDKLTDAKQGLYQTIYLTLTIKSENIREARASFSSLEAALRSAFIQIGVNGMSGSQLHPMGIDERLQMLYNFSHVGIKTNFKFNYEREVKSECDWVNTVSPGYICFYNDYFRINTKFGRVMHVKSYPKSLESDIIAELSNINCTSYITLNSELLDTTGLKQEIGRKYASVGMKIENEKQRNRNNNDYLTDASESLTSQKEALDDFVKLIDEGDDHYFNTTLLIMFIADTLEDLDKITEKLKTTASVASFELETSFAMQREALNSAYPFGVQEFKRCCNFSAPCLAMFMPYKTQELNDDCGTYYGINQLSQNAIFANKKKLMNYNGLVLGKPGSGKSVFVKSEMISVYINNPSDQVIVIDPQNEYHGIATANGVNGSVISFNSTNEVYVNPLDVDFEGVDYTRLTEIISDKSDFLLTLLATFMKRDLSSEEQGVLDNVVERVYSQKYAFVKKLNGEDDQVSEYNIPEYMKSKEIVVPASNNMTAEEKVRAYSPTLQDIYQGLLDEDTPVSRKLAGHMQIFVNGSLSLFNHRTNVDLNSRFLVFNISKIKENLRTAVMLVMLETVRNTVSKNSSKGNWTHLYIDEFHELLGIPSVAEFILKLWKEIRKMHGVLTGITQNMVDLLNNGENSAKLSAILSNTEYFALMNQSSIDRDMLMKFLPQISPAMFNFVEGADSGTGLLKMGNVTIPFDLRMSKESEIYKLVNTDGNPNQQNAI